MCYEPCAIVPNKCDHWPHLSANSVASDEWRPIFDKILDGIPEGAASQRIPLDQLRQILEDDPLFNETIPEEVRDKLLGNVTGSNDPLREGGEEATPVTAIDFPGTF